MAPLSWTTKAKSTSSKIFMGTTQRCNGCSRKATRIPRIDPLKEWAEILPMANAAHIHMNKIRFGVISDSTFMQRQRQIAKFRRAGSRQANIDGHGLHVETVQSNAMAMAPQICVAPWSAVSADDVNLCSGTTRCFHQLMEKVEQPRVIVAHFSRAVIA